MQPAFKRMHLHIALALSAASLAVGLPASAQGQKPAQPSIIPEPRSITMKAGTVRIASGTRLCLDQDTPDTVFVANYLSALVQRTRGLSLPVRHSACAAGPTRTAIHLRFQPTTAHAESYSLDVSSQGIMLTAGDRAGLFYGAVTLWQLFTQTPARNTPVTLPAMQIDDSPRLAWRGIMLDSARHFQSAAFVQNLLDQMALHKLNVLHWHLSDDQGWRVEIKQYPRLTQVGAFRVPAGPAAQADIDPATHKPRLYGGFYTQDQVRHLVAYAAERNITIVPELDMPGHSTAAIAAYPELGSSPDSPKVPSSEWSIHSNIYNVNDATFTFLQNVLLEVMAIFPGPYIHVGGDEATKDQWKASSSIQAQMKALGIADETGLQSYFIQRIGTFLTAHNRKLVGWDEIMQGGLAPNAVVMSWHGVAGGISAAKLGHDAVLTPQRPLYFNFRQSDATDEPPGRAPLNTLQDVYTFEPAPSAKLTPDELKHIIGVQANLWTEHVRTEDRVEHMLFPRAAALAEVAWSPENRDWQGFLGRLVAEYSRYRELGLPAAESPFEVRTQETLDPAAHTVQVALADQVSFGAIHYTLDGSAPTAASPAFTTPLTLPLPTKLRAGAFDGKLPITSPITRDLTELTVRRRDSRELQSCAAATLVMEDDAPIGGNRAIFAVNYLNPCWIYKGADLDSIRKVAAGVGQIPFNLKLGNSKPVINKPDTPDGELQVYLDQCKGKPLVSLPLSPAVPNNAVTELQAPFPALEGKHDLCLTFTRPNNDFIWAVNWVQLVPAPR